MFWRVATALYMRISFSSEFLVYSYFSFSNPLQVSVNISIDRSNIHKRRLKTEKAVYRNCLQLFYLKIKISENYYLKGKLFDWSDKIFNCHILKLNRLLATGKKFFQLYVYIH